jgi:hypothetical protein
VTLYAPAQTASAHPAAATQLERIAAALEPPC